ncbi:hypothetical protein Dsin_026545 [Dipteronia sinensis]|uniref:PGG domain-containing protein n=1 Tax=Dipteronia sinensis TaxID=43782 RepID=A0AAD9ZY40_9ROSI|nr:hypothetical protein Dsin_026545 [Dipteronia sinensis]
MLMIPILFLGLHRFGCYLQEQHVGGGHTDCGGDFSDGINPTGGPWQETEKGKGGHEAGKAILASLSHHLFLMLNTLAFSISTQIILKLVYLRKLYFEIVVPQFQWWQHMARRFGHSRLKIMSSFVRVHGCSFSLPLAFVLPDIVLTTK